MSSRFLVACVATLMVSPARTHVHTSPDGSTVDWYPRECCNDRDCRPVVQIKSAPLGLWMTTDNGETVLVGPQDESPTPRVRGSSSQKKPSGKATQKKCVPILCRPVTAWRTAALRLRSISQRSPTRMSLSSQLKTPKTSTSSISQHPQMKRSPKARFGQRVGSYAEGCVPRDQRPEGSNLSSGHRRNGRREAT